MKKVTVSAPGKLLLFGEHAVVYGRPCLVTAVGQRMKVTVELISEPVFQLNAPDVQITNYQKPISELGKGDPSTSLGTGIPKGAKFVEIAVKNFLASQSTSEVKKMQLHLGGVRVITKSQFSSQFGFGSSSASTVCVIKALSELTDKKLTNKQIFDLAYKTVLDVQGKGSGADIAAAVYGGTLYFVTGGKVIKPLNISSLPLIIGYSGIKADTITIVNQVLEKAKKYPKQIENIYTSIQSIVDLARKSLLKSDWETAGELMNFNQGYLVSLGVSSQKLDNMINAAKDAGAYGAKLSGAGGGDCMISLAPPSKMRFVEQVISKASGQVINIKTNVEGVKVE